MKKEERMRLSHQHPQLAGPNPWSEGHTWLRSLVLEEGVLLEEATEAGLLGASPFFSARALSRPFSGGEWAGLTRGVAGSCETGETVCIPSIREGSPGSACRQELLGGPAETLPRLTSLETSTTRSSLLSPSLS